MPEGAFIAPSSLKRARRAVVEALLAGARRAHAVTAATAAELTEGASRRVSALEGPRRRLALVLWSHRGAARGARRRRGRRLPRLRAHRQAWDGVSCPPRERRASWGVAPPRIRKPGEEKIDRYLAALEPDLVLVRAAGRAR
ncbi:MAG: hypothetical protein U0235_04470 [Polyangiaceae bacterium]